MKSYDEESQSDKECVHDTPVKEEEEEIVPQTMKETTRPRRAKPQSYKDLSSDSEAEESEASKNINETAKRNKSPSISAFSKSRYAAGLQVEGGDWRIHSAIDY